ncbi:hypothetical protein V6N13_058491 [Hibiscus sabdariffa]
MATVVYAETIGDGLHGWGLGDTKVKSLGGQKFLLQFEDEELVQLLEEKNWSLLEEVFSKVEYWSESMKNDNRITWVEIRGIPLHCWNYETFTRIIEGWGKIIVLGENGNMFHDGERVSEIPLFFHTRHLSKKNNREKEDGRKEGSTSVSSSTGMSQSLKSKGRRGEKNDGVDSVNVKNLGSDATSLGKNKTIKSITKIADESKQENEKGKDNRSSELSSSLKFGNVNPSWAEIVKGKSKPK